MKTVITILLLALSLNVFAVDGYKETKFGMTLSEVKSQGLCTLYTQPEIDGIIHMYMCEDFLFNGKKTYAYFYFINNQLLRFSFIAGSINEIGPITHALVEIYGDASTPVTYENLKSFDAGKAEGFDIAFDQDTVALRVARLTGKTIAMMIYTSMSYDTKVLESMKVTMAKQL